MCIRDRFRWCCVLSYMSGIEQFRWCCVLSYMSGIEQFRWCCVLSYMSGVKLDSFLVLNFLSFLHCTVLNTFLKFLSFKLSRSTFYVFRCTEFVAETEDLLFNYKFRKATNVDRIFQKPSSEPVNKHFIYYRSGKIE